MPPRSVKMKRFIFGFQRRVWWPKWTPASSRSFMETTGIERPFLGLIAQLAGGSRRGPAQTRRKRRPPSAASVRRVGGTKVPAMLAGLPFDGHAPTRPDRGCTARGRVCRGAYAGREPARARLHEDGG